MTTRKKSTLPSQFRGITEFSIQPIGFQYKEIFRFILGGAANRRATSSRRADSRASFSFLLSSQARSARLGACLDSHRAVPDPCSLRGLLLLRFLSRHGSGSEVDYSSKYKYSRQFC